MSTKNPDTTKVLIDQNERFINAIEKIAENTGVTKQAILEINHNNQLHASYLGSINEQIKSLQTVNKGLNGVLAKVMYFFGALLLLVIFALIVVAGVEESIKLWQESVSIQNVLK